LRLSAAAERRAPIIERTCAFDAKIYKIVGGFFAVSACMSRAKKIFQISDFCSALPSLLVEKIGMVQISQIPGNIDLRLHIGGWQPQI
jgi:hypothetical protein